MRLEETLVEYPIIEKLKSIGWEYDENLKSPDTPILVDTLRRKIKEINDDVELTENDIKTVINELQNLPITQSKKRNILRFYKFGIPIKTEKEKILKNIKLFDFKNPERNDFTFTNQFEFYGKEKIRLDIILFVNGIPLVNIECKNPYTNKSDYLSAYKQIKRYERTAEELYKYIQIGIAFAEKVKYFPIVPNVENVKLETWKAENLSDEEAIFTMLYPETLLDIIANFILIREFRGEMTKVITRYMQYRAVNKIFQRVMDNLNGKTNKNKGLIWHWQGSGKTLSMIFAARKIYYELGNPTIFFIVDRQDLERQLDEELKSLDLGFEHEKIDSISKLVDVLTHDGGKGKRGVFLTLIHKFNLEKLFLERVGEISKRKDIICFLDEVHRSQYGLLASKLKNVLKNAFFFGFTGTPISIQERDTFREFGYISEDEPFLDKYFMDQAEKDEFIVPIIYELRKEKVKLEGEPKLEKLLKEYLEETMKTNLDIEDLTEEEKEELGEAVKRKINEITVILENPNNIKLICQDIANHYKQNFDGKFKGLIVTASRKACVRFKKMIDHYLPPEYSEVVMTFDKDDEEINEYARELTGKYKIKDLEEITKTIIENYKKKEYPKLLIVTDMLITGFDEPKLGVLYLFKPLKDHRLLQTISRVNRPYKEKHAGLVVDYAGIFKYIEKALSIYRDEDIETIKESIVDKNKEWEKLKELLKELLKMFGNLVGRFDKESLEKAFRIVINNQDEFSSLYRELRRTFEFLGSDPRIVEVEEQYKWLSLLYDRYKKLLRPDVDEREIEQYLTKTLEIIQNLVLPIGIKPPKVREFDLQELTQNSRVISLDYDYIKDIRSLESISESEKYIGIVNTLKYISATKSKNPVYKIVAERVKRIIERWEEGEEILNLRGEIEETLRYIEEKEKEREESKLNDLEFGVKLVILEKVGKTKINIQEHEAEAIAKELFSKIKDKLYRNWQHNSNLYREISREVGDFLVKLKPKYQIPYEEFKELRDSILSLVSEYEPEN